MRPNSLILVIIAIFLSCSCMSHESQVVPTREESRHSDPTKMAFEFSDDDVAAEIKLVITTYLEFAENGKYEEIDKLIATDLVSVDLQIPKNDSDPNKDAPNPKLTENWTRSYLEESLPRLFFRVPMDVEQFILKNASDHSAEVIVVLKFESHEAEKIAINFGLKKQDQQWKIYSATHTAPPKN